MPILRCFVAVSTLIVSVLSNGQWLIAVYHAMYRTTSTISVHAVIMNNIPEIVW